jgi:hypothetical protein
MRNSLLIGAFALLSNVAFANADITVLHGIPGANGVDILANNSVVLPGVDYTQSATLNVPAGSYDLAVNAGSTTVVSLSGVQVENDKSYTVVAHLDANGQPKLSAFGDDISPVSKGEARLIVRHLAEAPAVDVVVRRWWSQTKLFENVSNGGEGVIDVAAKTYYVQLNATGSRRAAFGPVRVSLEPGVIYRVHAIGKLGEKNFQLAILPVKSGSTGKPLASSTDGTSCGGSISVSKAALDFDEKFDLKLSGAKADSAGLLHMGNSDKNLFFIRLPLSLDVLGAKGCSLYQNTQVIRPIRIDSNGDASFETMIPASAKRYFRGMHYQFSFIDQSANALGLVLTDYASVEMN